MKRKFLTSKEYQKAIKPEEKLSFSRKSPFNSITLPKTAIFFALHGPEALVLNYSTGTAYICRKDNNDPDPLNFDVYSISATEDPGIIEIKISPKQKYHWAKNLPEFMKGPASKWVKEEIKNQTKVGKLIEK